MRCASIVLLLLTTVCAGAAVPTTGKVARDGFDLYYHVYGEGKPVLILTGGPGVNCNYMMPVAEEIGKTHLAILPELRGTGRSRPPAINRDTVNRKLYLEDFEALRQALKLERWAVLGHSAGGSLAMAYAGAHPERVEALILVASSPPTGQSLGSLKDNLYARLGTTTGDLTPGYFYDRSKVSQLMQDAGPNARNADTNELMTPELTPPGYDLRPQLKAFSGPVLVLNGRQDPIDPGAAYETHLTFKGSQLKLIRRCGHFPWLEQPQEFYEAVRAFLKDSGRPAPRG